ncbi:MAG: M28 family peptidase [Bacteriovoracaceae bacterium]
MLKLIILAIFSFPIIVLAKSPSSYGQAHLEVSQNLSSKNLVQIINEFVRVSAPSRMIGKRGHDKAIEYIKSTIEKFDSKKSGKSTLASFSPDIIEAQNFYQNDFNQKVEGKIAKTHPDYQKWLKFTLYMKGVAEKYKDVKGQNIIWEKAGLNPNKVLILSAHYDTVSHDPRTLEIRENDSMPGANYNASGVSIALGVIKLLAKIDLNYSVQVAFLDWQSIGFLGSYQYAKELKNSGKEILGIINLEMLGQDTSYFDRAKKIGNMCVYTRPDREEVSWVRGLLAHGAKFNNKVDFDLRPNSFESSDNFRFWEQGLKAATFTQNWEDDFNPKFYQTPQDTPETLNHETLYSSYQYLAGATLGTLLDLTK